MIKISCTLRPYGMAADKYDTAGVIILDLLNTYAEKILKSAEGFTLSISPEIDDK